jgi:hypothetical protein
MIPKLWLKGPHSSVSLQHLNILSEINLMRILDMVPCIVHLKLFNSMMMYFILHTFPNLRFISHDYLFIELKSDAHIVMCLLFH